MMASAYRAPTSVMVQRTVRTLQTRRIRFAVSVSNERMVLSQYGEICCGDALERVRKIASHDLQRRHHREKMST